MNIYLIIDTKKGLVILMLYKNVICFYTHEQQLYMGLKCWHNGQVIKVVWGVVVVDAVAAGIHLAPPPAAVAQVAGVQALILHTHNNKNNY